MDTTSDFDKKRKKLRDTWIAWATIRDALTSKIRFGPFYDYPKMEKLFIYSRQEREREELMTSLIILYLSQEISRFPFNTKFNSDLACLLILNWIIQIRLSSIALREGEKKTLKLMLRVAWQSNKVSRLAVRVSVSNLSQLSISRRIEVS